MASQNPKGNIIRTNFDPGLWLHIYKRRAEVYSTEHKRAEYGGKKKKKSMTTYANTKVS